MLYCATLVHEIELVVLCSELVSEVVVWRIGMLVKDVLVLVENVLVWEKAVEIVDLVEIEELLVLWV